MRRNSAVKTYRDLVRNVREVEGNKLSDADREILAELVQEVVLPDGVSLDDPIEASVLDWIIELPDSDDPDLDLVCNIASCSFGGDPFKFFEEHRYLEPYLNDELSEVVDNPYIDFSDMLGGALTEVLFDWALAFIEQAKEERLRLVTRESE